MEDLGELCIVLDGRVWKRIVIWLSEVVEMVE